MPQARDEAGNIWEVDAQGEPVRLIQAAGASQQRGTVYTPPPKPAPPREAPSGYRWTVGGGLEVIPGGPADKPEKATGPAGAPDVTAKVRADAIRQFYGANALTQKTGGLAGKYREGPGATKGFGGIQDIFPTEQNRSFDDAGLQLRGYVKDALGFTGGEGNTVGEVQLNYGPYLPEASDWDGRIEGKIGALYGLANDSRERAIATLGGVPGQDGNIYPVGSPEAQNILGSVGHGKIPNVWDQPSAEAPAQQGAQGSVLNAITGNTRTRYERSPQLEAQVAAAFKRGASLEELNAITIPAGFGPINTGDYQRAAQARNKGQGGDVTFTIGRNVPLSRMEELSGSPTGAAAIGLGNAGSFGLVKGLAGDQYNEAERMNGGAMLAGEIAGSIGGTSLLANLGKKAAGNLGSLGAKLATGGGKGGAFVRNLATDTAYSGLYGAGSGDGVVSSMVAGGLGSVGGQAAGKLTGKFLGGITQAPGARKLADAGVPLTVGQNAGGVLKGIEDRMAGYPIVGDIIGNRRVEGFQGFERAAMNEAGAPIGAKFDGGNWSEQLPPEFGQAYDNATAGVNVPLDPQFNGDLQQLAAQSRNLPPDLAQRFTAAMDNRMQPIAQAGQMTGETYQQGMRGLSGYKAEMTKPGFEADYRDALSGAQDVLKNQMMRGGGSDVVEGLGKADQGYRMAKVVQEAQRKAVNGTGSGVPNLFTPAQLNAASMANMKKFGGKRPFSQLAAAGQQVLPSKIPDSGTAGRLAQLALPATIAGGAGAGGYAMGGGEGATTGGLSTLGALAALSLGGTKGGQKAINALLFKRPNAVKGIKAQRAVRKLQGLFGSAAVPLALESGN